MVNNKLLYAVGALFLGIAAVLTISELHLCFGWSVALALTLLAIGALGAKNRQAQLAASGVFAALGVAGPIAYFLNDGEASFYVSTIVYLVGSLLLAFRYGLQLDAGVVNENSRSIAIAVAAIASSLGFFGLTYFRYLTSMQDDFVARRLVFTLFLLVVGIVLAVVSRWRTSVLLGYGGMTYLLAGVGKALAYDTTHVTGFLRIGIFAAGGVILLAGAALLSRKGSVQ